MESKKIKVTCECGREITPSLAAKVMAKRRKPISREKAQEMVNKRWEKQRLSPEDQADKDRLHLEMLQADAEE